MKIKVNIVMTLLAIVGTFNICTAQQVNWRSFKDEQKHVLNLQTGWDYGLVAGIGYGYKFKTKLPVILNMEYTIPFGNDMADDFKTKLGGQAELLKFKNFSVSAKAHFIFRRYQNQLVRLVNFGSEFSTNFGYYRPQWYVAGEFGFDKAITTHIKNGIGIKDNYPGIKDGWSTPTGGNFFYGIIYDFSFYSNDLYIKIGKSVTQDLKTTASIPFYLQLGYNRKF